MIVAFSISPSGGDETGGVSEAVAEAVRTSGRAVEAVAASSPRTSLVLKADLRPGYEGQLGAKVARVDVLLDDA